LNALPSLFADNILPIIIVAGVGYLLQRTLDLDTQTLSRVVFYGFTPPLVFTLLVSVDIHGTDILRMLGLAASVMTAIGVLAWVFGRALKLQGTMITALVLTATFLNAGNYGLSLTNFALGEEGLAWASIYFIASAMAITSVGVYIANIGRLPPIEALKGLFKVPAVYAIPLALFVRSMDLSLPPALWRPINLMSDAALPAMLLMLGMQISDSGFPERKGLLAVAVALRLLVSPLVGYILSPHWGLTGVSRSAAILESAMPTAVMTTILATEFDVNPDFVTGTVLVSTLLSPLTVTPILALLGG
jgi:predicted permease